uniref:Uncharacterized protein n=1 Tax=Anguilla anguilla TaxID=7936 RepID=A0A0E9SXB3_ANGAN
MVENDGDPKFRTSRCRVVLRSFHSSFTVGYVHSDSSEITPLR